MNENQFPSKLLENAVNHFAKLPGVGPKTALRLVLYLLKQPEEEVVGFGNSLIKLKKEIVYCKICHNISDGEICDICSNMRRDDSIICVVENIKDVMAIEKTSQFNGKYHILGGIISPMDGIGPSDLNISSLEAKAKTGKIKEIIFALSATMEGDTTNFYLHKKLHKYEIEFSTIARGVAIGGEIEYIDEITLGRSIVNRTSFETSLSK